MSTLTKRKNGKRMMSIRMTFYVPEELLDFIRRGQSVKTLAAAERFVRSRMESFMDDWHVLALDIDGDLTFINTDDIESCLNEGYDVYEGDAIVVDRGRWR